MNTQNTRREKGKYIDIELMRIIACFFVIFNHTETNGYFLFSLYDKHSIQFWIYLFLSIFCKFSVPLFFTIFGALMLDREPEPLNRLWRYRILKMVIVLITWSLFYFFVEVYSGSFRLDFREFVKQLYSYSWNYSFWYLYAYISMLMTLPLLQKIVKSFTNRDFVYILILVICFSSLLPVAEFILWQDKYSLNWNFRLRWLCTDIFIYPCLGYFLETRLKVFWTFKKIFLIWLINIGTIILAGYLTYAKSNITGILDEGNSQTFHSTFAMINCMTIFVTLKYICSNYEFPDQVKRMICSVGTSTFGIYLLHVFYKEKIPAITQLWDIFHHQFRLNYMFSALLYCGVVFVLGYATTILLKQIPVLNKII